MKMRLLQFLILFFTIFLTISCASTQMYHEIQTSGSIIDYENYLTKYPKSRHYLEVKAELDRLYEERDWKTALRYNSINKYEEFCSSYPDSKYKEAAKEKIDVLIEKNDWERASGRNTIYSYETFVSSYPESKYTYQARSKMQELKEEYSWDSAIEGNTSESYLTYLDKFPYGKYAVTAKQRIKEIEIIEPEWQVVIKKNTREGYIDFLKKYSDSSYARKARLKLHELENDFWKRTQNTNTTKAYKKYLSEYPDGTHSKEAEKQIIDIEVENIFSKSHSELPSMDKTSDRSWISKETSIEIYNNTTFTLTVRYSGNESKRIVLNPNERKSIQLLNGKYRITASVSASNVSHYAGTENLDGGEYVIEYYIVTETRNY